MDLINAACVGGEEIEGKRTESLKLDFDVILRGNGQYLNNFYAFSVI